MTATDTQSVHRTATRITEECLAVRVRMLNRTITTIYDDALRPLGLTAGQLNIMVVVTARGPISPGEVAHRLNMEKSTVSRNVERMRKNGWLAVTAAESGHKQQLTLTRRGRTLLAKSHPAWEEAQITAREVLGQRGAEAIHRAAATVWSRTAPG